MSFTIGDTTEFKEVHKKKNNNVSLLDYVNENRRLGFFNDVEISTGSDSFPANRMVLSCFSAYFEKMFKIDMREKHQTSIEIKCIDGNSMGDVIEYIYTGNVKINSKNVCDLLCAADYLQVNDLTEFCFEFLNSVITPENCFAVIGIAERYQKEVIKTHAVQVISENFALASATNGFKKLNKDDLIDCVLSQDRSRISEDVIFTALVDWIKYDEENRSADFPHVLRLVNCHRLPYNFLEDVVLKENLVMQNHELCRLFLLVFSRLLNNTKQQQFGTRILSLGGVESQSKVMEVYNDFNEPAKSFPDLPSNRFNGCSVALNNCLYFCGGRHSQKGVFKNVWRMKLEENTFKWEEIAPMIEPRTFMGAAVFNDSVVVVGGHNGEKRLATGERYSMTSKAWEEICPMLECRSLSALASCNNHLYAIGGFDNDDHCLSTVECLVSSEEKWKYVKSMNTPRRCLAAASCNGFVYAIGGQAGEDDNTTLKSVEKYNPSNNQWQYVSDMNFARKTCAVCVLQNKIFVIGGLDDKDKAIRKIECYNPFFDRWTIIGETNGDLFYHSLAVL